MYSPVLEATRRAFADFAAAAAASEGSGKGAEGGGQRRLGPPRVLVPGCGAGRLAWELAVIGCVLKQRRADCRTKVDGARRLRAYASRRRCRRRTGHSSAAAAYLPVPLT